MPRNLLALMILGLAVQEPVAAEQIAGDHVVVSYVGIPADYATAIAHTVAAARQAAISQFGFDLPEVIQVAVQVNEASTTALWTNGRDRIFLTLASERDLRKPSESGYFQLYGLCHEVGHMAMYRLIPNHVWLTAETCEGWAHYLGSRLVDIVYAAEGPNLWPDHYDYREDGMERLRSQWEDAGENVSGSSVWHHLVEIVSDRGIAQVLRAWGQSRVNSVDQAVRLGPMLAVALQDRRVLAWWQRSQGVLVGVPASPSAPATKRPARPRHSRR